MVCPASHHVIGNINRYQRGTTAPETEGWLHWLYLTVWLSEIGMGRGVEALN
jgi:hypothetical protein